MAGYLWTCVIDCNMVSEYNDWKKYLIEHPSDYILTITYAPLLRRIVIQYKGILNVKPV